MSYSLAGAIEDEIDSYANQIVDTIYTKFETRVRQGMPALIEEGVAVATPLVTNAASQYAPQLLSDLQPQLQRMTSDLMASAMQDTTLQQMMDAKERKMGIALAVTSIATIVGVVAALSFMKDGR